MFKNLLVSLFLVLLIGQVYLSVRWLLAKLKASATAKKLQNLLFCSLMAEIALFYLIAILPSTPPKKPSKAKQHVKIETVVIGKTRFKDAKKASISLLEEQASLNADASSLKAASEKLAKQSAKQSSSTAVQSAKVIVNSSPSTASSSSNTGSNQDVSAATKATQSESVSTKSSQGLIVGNKNTKVYHTPDQENYSMAAKNAVYFKTESEAIANGYHKSKR